MSENPVLNLMRPFFGPSVYEVPVKDRRIYTRDDLVRLVIGQQWAVAIALAYQAGVMVIVVPDEEAAAVGDLPCAHDVVEGMEKP